MFTTSILFCEGKVVPYHNISLSTFLEKTKMCAKHSSLSHELTSFFRAYDMRTNTRRTQKLFNQHRKIIQLENYLKLHISRVENLFLIEEFMISRSANQSLTAVRIWLNNNQLNTCSIYFTAYNCFITTEINKNFTPSESLNNLCSKYFVMRFS